MKKRAIKKLNIDKIERQSPECYNFGSGGFYITQFMDEQPEKARPNKKDSNKILIAFFIVSDIMIEV